MKAALSSTVFWLLLPAIAVQGLRLRRRALRLPGAVGDRQGSVGSGPDLHMLALGDSIIDGVGAGRTEASLPVQYAVSLAEAAGRRVHWRLEGASGRDIGGVLAHLDTLQHLAPIDLVLLSVGVNDVTGLSRIRHWRRSVDALLLRIRELWPGAHIVFAGLPPIATFPLLPQPLRFALGLRAATLDRIALERIADCPGATHVGTGVNPKHHDFCADGFHPSAESCTLWARDLAARETGRKGT